VLIEVLLTAAFVVVSIMAKFAVVWPTTWQPEQPIFWNVWNPAVIEAADVVELLLEDAPAVEVEEVEDPAAAGRTDANATVVDAGAVELVLEVEVDEIVEVLDDASVEVDEVLADAAADVVKGTAGVGGASIRMNIVKLTMSELKSDAWLELSPPSAVGTVSSGKGAGEHCGEALEFRSLGNRSLVTPSSTL
jgi:hypothetical protein